MLALVLLNGLQVVIIIAITTIQIAILLAVVWPVFLKNSRSVCISLDSHPVKYNQ